MPLNPEGLLRIELGDFDDRFIDGWPDHLRAFHNMGQCDREKKYFRLDRFLWHLVSRHNATVAKELEDVGCVFPVPQKLSCSESGSNPEGAPLEETGHKIRPSSAFHATEKEAIVYHHSNYVGTDVNKVSLSGLDERETRSEGGNPRTARMNDVRRVLASPVPREKSDNMR